MRKLHSLGLICLGGIIVGLAWAEELTLTTYYPAPYGVYRDMTVDRELTVRGEIDFEDDVRISAPGSQLHLNAPNDSIWTNTPYLKVNQGSLYVDNYVGIGTIDPRAKLHVTGGIRANKGEPVGDASNIGYAFERDGDTGMFAVGGDAAQNSDLSFQIDDEEHLRITDAGDVVVQGGLTLGGQRITKWPFIAITVTPIDYRVPYLHIPYEIPFTYPASNFGLSKINFAFGYLGGFDLYVPQIDYYVYYHVESIAPDGSSLTVRLKGYGMEFIQGIIVAFGDPL